MCFPLKKRSKSSFIFFPTEKPHNFRYWSALGIATVGGVGFLPWVPGTWGSLVGLALAYFSQDWGVLSRLLLWGSLILAGCWAAQVLYEVTQVVDLSQIVIDEVVGIGIASWIADTSWIHWSVAFVLFRICDILKPPPVRQIDHWSKKGSHRWKNSLGVMADDCIAGLQALALIGALQWLDILP